MGEGITNLKLGRDGKVAPKMARHGGGFFLCAFAVINSSEGREGAKCSWWYNPVFNERSAIPRHSEIQDVLAKEICKDHSVAMMRGMVSS